MGRVMAPSARRGHLSRWDRFGTGLCLLIALSLLLLCSPAQAHRLQVFASVDGDQIQGRVYFVGGHPAKGVAVELLDAEGEHVAELSSNDEGRFRIRAPAAQDYRVVAQSGDGHRAEWPIAASELAGAFKDLPPTVARAANAPSNGSSLDGPTGPESPESPERSDASSCFAAEADVDPVLGALIERAIEQAIEPGLEQRVPQAVEQAVARQVLPLREALAQAQAQASFRDLLGGLGYIAGIAGFGLWWTQRREKRRSGKDERGS